MRYSLPIAALFPLLLAACASAPNVPAKAVDQSGTLKVHPGLLGQPVPPELQPEEPPARAPAAPATAEGAPGQAAATKAAEAGQDTERSVYFDLNSAEIKPSAAAALRPHADYLGKNPGARVRVEGNADERGPADYNRKLGQKRAESVKQFLVAQGAGGKQVKVVSRGAGNPKRSGHDEESWAENRRADIVFEKR